VAPRRESRERALGLCYESEVREVEPPGILEGLPTKPDEYALQLFEGVYENREAIDKYLTEFSQNWSLERMPMIDRCILRIAAYELLYAEEVPTAVAISEAVDLAKQYSTKDSGRFVNGLLARVASEVRAS
jgi:N utilization substance protein B